MSDDLILDGGDEMDKVIDLDALDQVIEAPREDRPVPCEFLCGRAGVGKSYQLMQRVAANDSYALVGATTGIAAVNIGAVTLNSLLRYFDTASMRDAFLAGHLIRTLHEIAKDYRYIAVEETSMMDGDQLDLLYRGVEEANRYADVESPLGILLVGDFAQLPPIKAKWAFEADCWDKFHANTTRLDKVYRQDGGLFLDALNAARSGNGGLAAELLTAAGCVWHTALDTEFDGTTILPKNDMVSRYNDIALNRVPGKRFTITSRRWGAQRKEWGENSRTHEWGIPQAAEYKLGAYVMILANASDFSYVNGDCGHVTAYEPNTFTIKLIRTGKEVRLRPIIRAVDYKSEPDGWVSADKIPASLDAGSYIDHQHYRGKARRYVMGQVQYLPIRLAYASTVHKAQGLTLDKIQVDIRDHFFGHPAMAYVALSRCRTLEGLRIIGQRERFAMQVKVDSKVKAWL